MRVLLVLLALLSPASAWDEKGPTTIFGLVMHLNGSTFEMPHSNRGPIKVIVTAPMLPGLIDGDKVILQGTFSPDGSTFTATVIKKDG